jgi:hypothetical protein
MLSHVKQGGTFLLTSLHGPDDVWETLPLEVQQTIIKKKLKFYVIDAIKIAEDLGLGSRINVIMQTAFFKISGVIDAETAVAAIKTAIKKTYGKKGDKIVNMNNDAVDAALSKINEVEVPDQATSTMHMHKMVPDDAPDFVKEVTGEIMAGRGDDLRCRAMESSQRQRLNTKSETSLSIFPLGNRMSVSSVPSAPWSAHMRRFASRPTIRNTPRALRRPSRVSMPRARTLPE